MKYVTSAIAELRIEVEQLRREVEINRIPVSKAIADIKSFVQDQQQDDPLLTNQGKPKPSNLSHRRRKSSCSLQ